VRPRTVPQQQPQAQVVAVAAASAVSAASVARMRSARQAEDEQQRLWNVAKQVVESAMDLSKLQK